MKKKLDNQKQNILKKFKECFKDFLNSSDVQDLIPYVTKVDKSKTIEEKIENIQKLSKELDKLYRQLEYLIHCAKTLLSKVSFGSIMKKMKYKHKLQVSEQEFYCLLDFKILMYKELKNLEDQIENVNLK